MRETDPKNFRSGFGCLVMSSAHQAKRWRHSAGRLKTPQKMEEEGGNDTWQEMAQQQQWRSAPCKWTTKPSSLWLTRNIQTIQSSTFWVQSSADLLLLRRFKRSHTNMTSEVLGSCIQSSVVCKSQSWGKVSHKLF